MTAEQTNKEPLLIDSVYDVYKQLKADHDFSFIALKGKEGGRTTYSAKLSFGQIAQCFSQAPSCDAVPNEFLLQRELTQSRANKIKQYL